MSTIRANTQLLKSRQRLVDKMSALEESFTEKKVALQAELEQINKAIEALEALTPRTPSAAESELLAEA